MGKSYHVEKTYKHLEDGGLSKQRRRNPKRASLQGNRSFGEEDVKSYQGIIPDRIYQKIK